MSQVSFQLLQPLSCATLNLAWVGFLIIKASETTANATRWKLLIFILASQAAVGLSCVATDLNTQSDNMWYVAMLPPTHVVGSLEECGFLNIKRSFAAAGTAAQLLLPGWCCPDHKHSLEVL